MADASDLDPVIARALDEVLARHDPVPATVRTYARAVFDLHALDAEVATLVFDSAVGQPVGARAEPERVTVFEAAGFSVELREDVGSHDVLGRLDPATSGDFLVRTSHDCAGGVIDVAGTFRFERPASIFTLRLVLGDRIIDTDAVAW